MQAKYYNKNYFLVYQIGLIRQMNMVKFRFCIPYLTFNVQKDFSNKKLCMPTRNICNICWIFILVPQLMRCDNAIQCILAYPNGENSYAEPAVWISQDGKLGSQNDYLTFKLDKICHILWHIFEEETRQNDYLIPF